MRAAATLCAGWLLAAAVLALRPRGPSARARDLSAALLARLAAHAPPAVVAGGRGVHWDRVVVLVAGARARRLLIAAGATDGATLLRLVGWGRLATTAGLGLAVAGLLPLVGGAALPVAVAAAAAGALVPDIVLLATARGGEERLTAALPATLELVASSSRAGLALQGALRLAAAHAPRPLDGPLWRAAARSSAGEGAAEALLAEATRTDAPALVAMASTLARHQRLGQPLEPPLRRLATSLRLERRRALRRRAARRSMLVSLVTAAVVVPACVLALGCWLVVAVVEGGAAG